MASVAAARTDLRIVRLDDRPLTRTEAANSARNTVIMLIGTAAFLTGAGLIMVLSASSVSAYAQYGSSFLFFQRQAVYAVVGVAALLLTSKMRYAVWQRLAVPFLSLSIGLLLLVLSPSIGTTVSGSARWIAFGPITIQPSEIAKLAVIVFVAMIVTKKRNHLDELAHLALPLGPVMLAIGGLVMLQPDLGTTVILAGSVFMLLFAAGVRLRYLATVALTGTALGLALIFGESYRRARLLSFLHPWADPMKSGYQLVQSLIALGSGGWTGVGLGASRQKWMYVPNAHTDFIFSILGEELGLVGEVVVIAAFCLLLYAGIRVATRAPDMFGRLLAAGIVSWFGLQALVNLGAVTGLLPITGVPLPFLSFGGSSLVISLAGVGILVNIARSPVAIARKASTKRRAS